MDKRVRLLKAHDTGSLIQEMAGDKVINQVFLMSRIEAAILYEDLGARYHFHAQMFDQFPSDITRESATKR